MARYIINQSDFERVLDAPINLRDRLILRLLFATGCRTMEIAKLKTKNVDVENRTLIILDSKKHGEYSLPIDSTTALMLKEYIAHKDNNVTSEYLFPSRRKCGYLCKETYIHLTKWYAAKLNLPQWEKWSPRMFRRYFARNWIRKNGSLTGLQDHLRHSSIASTAIYIESLRFQDENRSEYDRIVM